MKRTLLAASALTLAITAHAQNSVTLYGQIDNGLMYWTGMPGGRFVGMESGAFASSWWGLTGIEDLGGGTKAKFKLESGFSSATGQMYFGGLFVRHAYVALSNDKVGQLTLGNLGAGEIQEYSYDLDPQLMQQFAIQTLVRGRNWTYAGNGIEYASPNMGGLTIRAQYDLTNNPNGWNSAASSTGVFGAGPNQLGGAQGRTDGIMAEYAGAGLGLTAIYDETRDVKGGFSNVFVSSRSIMAGGTYTWERLRAYAGYQHLSAPDASFASYGITPGTLPSGVTGVPTAVDHEWVGLAYQLSPFTNFTGGVYHANANNGNGNATMYTLGGTYNLSKRTLLYTELAYLHNSSTSNVGLGNGYTDSYGPNGLQGGAAGNTSPNYGHSQFAAFAGIHTSF